MAHMSGKERNTLMLAWYHTAGRRASVCTSTGRKYCEVLFFKRRVFAM